jgi:hypothetical protein
MSMRYRLYAFAGTPVRVASNNTVLSTGRVIDTREYTDAELNEGTGLAVALGAFVLKHLRLGNVVHTETVNFSPYEDESSNLVMCPMAPHIPARSCGACVEERLRRTPRNQCDGCARGLPLEDGIHRGEGYDLIGCTAHLYR